VSAHVRERLFDYLKGDTLAEEAGSVEEHLSRCAACREDLRMLREAVGLLPRRGKLPSDERDEEFWASFPSTVEERIAMAKKSRTSVFAAAADRISSFVHFNRTPLLAGSGALAAIALAVLLLMRPAPVTAPAVPGNSPQTGTEAGNPDPAGTQLHDYLKKSRVLLVGVSNMRTGGDNTFDLSVERRESRELVHEARDLKRQPLDPRSAKLVGDLEKILIELANSDRTQDVPDVEIIRSGIRDHNLLFKIRMTESALAEAAFERNRQ
jgi:hypothetical protein